MIGKVMLDAVPKEIKRNPDFKEREEYQKLSEHEPRCQCGHGLYWHYMCGDPRDSFCQTRCGCAQFHP